MYDPLKVKYLTRLALFDILHNQKQWDTKRKLDASLVEKVVSSHESEEWYPVQVLMMTETYYQCALVMDNTGTVVFIVDMPVYHYDSLPFVDVANEQGIDIIALPEAKYHGDSNEA
jgi:hypothetical protein